jgi:hypothetical protein
MGQKARWGLPWDVKLIEKESKKARWGFQDVKLIVKAKNRPTGNISVKAAFHVNGCNP